MSCPNLVIWNLVLSLHLTVWLLDDLCWSDRFQISLFIPLGQILILPGLQHRLMGPCSSSIQKLKTLISTLYCEYIHSE